MAEFCLHHETRSKVGKAYLRSDRLEERREIMAKWAEFVTGKTVDDHADVWETKAIAKYHKDGGDGSDWRSAVEDPRGDD